MRNAIICCLLAVAPVQLLTAQDPALVEALAPILMTEDRRDLNPAILAPALEHPEVRVRRAAVLALGRIGVPDGVMFLIPRLQDLEPTLLADVFFAMGILRDQRAVGPIMARLNSADSLDAAALQEAAIALARIGGPAAIAAINEVIGGGGGQLSRARREGMLLPAMLESWRLGPDAPVSALLRYIEDQDTDRRWRAIFTLGRIQAPSAADRVLQAARDRVALIRETALKNLTRRYADSTGLDHATVINELRRAINDQEAGVRINALGALATFKDSASVDRVAPLLNDPDHNVRVAAAGALAAGGGSEAVTALASVFTMRGNNWALERAALDALAQTDTAVFNQHLAPWLVADDPLSRMVGLQLLARTRPGSDESFRRGMSDRDPRVRAAALGAWANAGPTHRETAAEAARSALRDSDPLVRRAAISALAPANNPGDIDLMAAAWGQADVDSREAIIIALGTLAREQPELIATLASPTRRVLLDRPADASLRALAARVFPALGARWAPIYPVETGRTLEDYRGIVRTFVLAQDNPRLIIDVEGRGNITIELFPREAPLTVANFLQLVGRGYFDGNRWHRVVPNFVVQDGDRTGLGNGGPGWAIRDEINRRQYDIPMLGMALSGPNSGGSQWFINLSPQPHLNGQYTIFGRVTGTYGPLKRVLQGDLIRTIRLAGQG